MASILLGALSGLASVTISLPLNPPQISCSGSKGKNTNATIRDLPFPAMGAAAHKPVVQVVPSTAPEAAITTRVVGEQVLWMTQTLPV